MTNRIIFERKIDIFALKVYDLSCKTFEANPANIFKNHKQGKHRILFWRKSETYWAGTWVSILHIKSD